MKIEKVEGLTAKEWLGRVQLEQRYFTERRERYIKDAVKSDIYEAVNELSCLKSKADFLNGIELGWFLTRSGMLHDKTDVKNWE